VINKNYNQSSPAIFKTALFKLIDTSSKKGAGQQLRKIISVQLTKD